MKFTDFFRKTKHIDKSGRFSDFFLHAPIEEKKEIMKEAARKANEEQREVFLKSQLKTKA